MKVARILRQLPWQDDDPLRMAGRESLASLMARVQAVHLCLLRPAGLTITCAGRAGKHEHLNLRLPGLASRAGKDGHLSLRLMHKQAGGTLPASLWALAVGALVMGPFLAHLSTSLQAGSAAQGDLLEQYSADASIEFGLWKLLYDQTYRNSVDVIPGTPVSIAPAVTVNGITSSTSVNANPIGLWNDMTFPTDTFGSGAALAHDGGDYIYALVGNNTDLFNRYSISGNSWVALNPPPAAVSDGGSLVHDGGDYLYALRGGVTTDFWRYSISADNWTTMPPTNRNMGAGASLAYDGGNNIYALRGNSNRWFKRFRISQNSWQNRKNPPQSVREGGSLVYTGGDYLYALRGRNSSTFWRYSISGNIWSTMANTLGTVTGGGALTWTLGDYLYAFRGSSSTSFWRYQISQDFWIPLQPAPAAVAWGGALAHTFGPDIFALRGNTQNNFWRFTITPPEFDLTTTAVDYTIDVHIQINGSSVTVESWDIN